MKIPNKLRSKVTKRQNMKETINNAENTHLTLPFLNQRTSSSLSPLINITVPSLIFSKNWSRISVASTNTTIEHDVIGAQKLIIHGIILSKRLGVWLIIVHWWCSKILCSKAVRWFHICLSRRMITSSFVLFSLFFVFEIHSWIFITIHHHNQAMLVKKVR